MIGVLGAAGNRIAGFYLGPSVIAVGTFETGKGDRGSTSTEWIVDSEWIISGGWKMFEEPPTGFFEFGEVFFKIQGGGLPCVDLFYQGEEGLGEFLSGVFLEKTGNFGLDLLGGGENLFGCVGYGSD